MATDAIAHPGSPVRLPAHAESRLATSSRRKRTATRLTMALFAGSILLPQGVGLPLPGGLPNLDLPRLAMLAVILLLVVKVTSTGRLDVRGAPRTLTLLAALSVWQMVSAAASEAPRGATVWALGNLLTTWLFAFAVISLAGGMKRREQVVRVLTVVAVLLSLWSVAEMVTQHKLVPVRNLWSGEESQSFSTSLRRLIPGSSIALPLISIGPFAVNLTLAGVLCTLAGFLLVRGRTSARWHRFHIALLALALFATQSRAAILAFAVMVVINLAAIGTLRERRRLIMVVAGALVLLLGGTQLWLALSTAYADAIAADSSSGSLGSRVGGLRLLADQFNRWWLVGFGPGSLFDGDRVPTSIQVFSDPGSYFAFFVESGLIAGLMLTALVVLSVRDGLRSRMVETRGAALGLIGFWITTLSSITPWGWGIALALAGLVESWTRGERRSRLSDTRRLRQPSR